MTAFGCFQSFFLYICMVGFILMLLLKCEKAVELFINSNDSFEVYDNVVIIILGIIEYIYGS